MKVAAVLALSELAREPVPADVLAACELDTWPSAGLYYSQAGGRRLLAVLHRR